MIIHLPYEEVLQLRTQLQGASGHFYSASTIPTANPYPLLGILSAGDAGNGITHFYSVLQYDYATNSYLTEYIDVSGNEFIGILRPLKDTEQIIQWKYTGPLSGTGLLGEYYEGINLDGKFCGTRYSNIDFIWSNQTELLSTLNLQPDGQFSVRWSGYIQIHNTGSYKFRTLSDDGIRLWIDDILVIDDWEMQGTTINTSPFLDLVEGYSKIKVEYNQYGGPGDVQLQWTTPISNNIYSIINTKYLYSPYYIHT